MVAWAKISCHINVLFDIDSCLIISVHKKWAMDWVSTIFDSFFLPL